MAKKKSQEPPITTASPVTHYAAEHLLTFQSQHKLKSASKVSIEVFQKVANLEKQNKLYVQDIIVHVDNGSVKLLDSQSFDVVENFQFSEQQLVTVFDLTGKFETVNSLLVLVTSESPRERESYPDIHVLQCAQRMHTASIITKDINAALHDYNATMTNHQANQKKNQKKRSNSIISTRSSVLVDNKRIIESIPPMPPPPPPEEPKEFETQLQETKYLTKVVNSCFDDIEAFVTKLYKVADAWKQVQNKQDPKSKKASGRARSASNISGMLSLRSRPPGQDEYLDIFRKIKYALNTMSRLEGRVLNPSPAEMFRHLQRPLVFIVQTTGGVDLAASVKVPMLKKATLDMVYRVTDAASKKPVITTSHWMELGENWKKPYEDYSHTDQIASDKYQPRFNSGWSPMAMENVKSGGKGGAKNKQPEFTKIFAESETRRAKVLQSWISNMPRELSVTMGDYVDVLDDSGDWWKCRNSTGVVGYVPQTILESDSVTLTSQNTEVHPVASNKATVGSNSVILNNARKSLVVQRFEFANRTYKTANLDIEADDRIGIMEEFSDGNWTVQDSYGNIGSAPATVFVAEVLKAVSPAKPPPPQRTTSKPSSISSAPTGPAPVAPPPPPPVEPAFSHISQPTTSAPPPPIAPAAARASNLPPVIDRLRTIKNYRNADISIAQGVLMEIFENEGNWWKVKGYNGNYSYVPSHIFEKKPKKKKSDQVSLKSERTDISSVHEELLSLANGGFKLKSVNRHYIEDEEVPVLYGNSPLRAPKPTNPVRRKPSRNNTPGLKVISRQQRPEMNQVVSSLNDRIRQESGPNFQVRGNARKIGQKLMVTPTSSKAEVALWLDQIGDISDITIESLSVLSGKLLFQLNKEDIKQICDDDWHRIYSHINIQKNLFERSHTSTLEKKLLEVRLRQEAKADL